MEKMTIYCGDNLDVLRRLPNDSIDLIYVDPPFATGPTFHETPSRVVDTDSRSLYPGPDVPVLFSDYFSMMGPRVAELVRILRPTASLYYHCDWRVEAYARLMLDQHLGVDNLRAQIIWPRSQARERSVKTFVNHHDSILFYSKTDRYRFHPQHSAAKDNDPSGEFRYTEPETGRRYRLESLSAQSQNRPGLTFEFLGVTRTWRWTEHRMREANEAGLIVQARPDSVPALKRYMDEEIGTQVGSIWDDIQPIAGKSSESLGYPTQKPLALLRRIIGASSDEGDTILDPFCGSGTALHAAQDLDRQWIGIDLDPSVCYMAGRRLEKEFGLRPGVDFTYQDSHRSEAELREFSPLQFESWAVIALSSAFVGAPSRRVSPWKDKLGIGARFYRATESVGAEFRRGETEAHWCPVQVKQRGAVNAADVSRFVMAMRRQKRDKGVYVSFEFSHEAVNRISAAQDEESLTVLPIEAYDLMETSTNL